MFDLFDVCNTPEHLAKYREKIQSGNYPALSSFDELWVVIQSKINNQAGYEWINRETFSDYKPTEILTTCVEKSHYPPPEVLIAISDCFLAYFISAGKLSLEEAFFGAPKKGVGNYAARKWMESQYKNFDTLQEAAHEIARGKGSKTPSLTEIAENHFREMEVRCNELNKNPPQPFDQPYESPDIDSFLRGYRRWKMNKE